MRHPLQAPQKANPAELLALLQRIERALHAAGLATVQPSPKALASTAPFCFDTLEFHAWLQWVFLPRMRITLIECAELPARCAIAPLAEYRFAELAYDTTELLALITAFDELANQYFEFSDSYPAHQDKSD
ncbi:MAG: YqcC family protein [Halothiobacillus sp.]